MSLRTPGNRHTTRTRDAALRRLSQANRWLLAASAALTAAFTAAAATAFPGRKATTGSVRGARARAADPRTAGTSASRLQAPAQTPRTSTQPEAGVAAGEAAGESVESAPAQTPRTSTQPESGEAAGEAVESAPVVSGGS